MTELHASIIHFKKQVSRFEGSLNKFSKTIKGLKILTVEDQPLVTKIYIMLGRKYGFSITNVDRVHKASSILNNYDLAILDVDLPDGKGTSLIPLAKVPIIVCTGLNFENEIIIELLNDYPNITLLNKPLDENEFIASIYACLR